MPTRVRQLDLLRALGVLLVLGRHGPPPMAGVVEPIHLLGQTWYDCGWIGVDLFFVLSGFLVSGLFFNEFRRHGEVRAGRFLVRRGFKIYPAFYCLLLFTILYLQPSGAGLRPFLTCVRNEALFLQNYLVGVYPHTWSLAVEEHFYLLMAVLMVVLTRRASPDPFRALVYIVPLGGAAALALRTRAALLYPLDVVTMTVPCPTHLRGDSLLWGVLLSYWYHCRDRAWLRTLQQGAPLVLLAVLVLLSPSVVWLVGRSKALLTIGLTSVALGFTVLLALVLPVEDASSPNRRASVLARVGRDSYSIYLWHIPVSLWLMPRIEATGLLAFGRPTLAYAAGLGTFLATSVLVGMAMSRVIERPSLVLRDRLFPSRSEAPGVKPATAPLAAAEP